jgi:nitric oxide reductase large subunit
MKRLWIVLAVVLTFGFTVLGWVGSRIYQEMPPIPERIVTTDGQVVAPDGTIRKGQAVWQTLGGDGGGLDLGSWQLRGARLDGQLAASRVRADPGRLGAVRARQAVRRLGRSRRPRCANGCG